MKALGKEFPNIYKEEQGNRSYLYTLNAYPGKTHFDEKTKEKEGVEYRYWDPTRSKLAAAILNGISQISIEEGEVVLYLGAGHGYTPSFVSDVIGGEGMVFCVDSAPRVVRDLIGVCEERDNMAPVMADANHPDRYEGLLPEEVDVVFQDVAQKNQVEIFMKNVDAYLKDGGFGLLSVKASSINVAENPKEVFRKVREELDESITISDYRELSPFEKNHAFFVCKKKS